VIDARPDRTLVHQTNMTTGSTVTYDIKLDAEQWKRKNNILWKEAKKLEVLLTLMQKLPMDGEINWPEITPTFPIIHQGGKVAETEFDLQTKNIEIMERILIDNNYKKLSSGEWVPEK
jgi:hypothetical protein